MLLLWLLIELDVCLGIVNVHYMVKRLKVKGQLWSLSALPP